jgi:hypothetical protein
MHGTIKKKKLLDDSHGARLVYEAKLAQCRDYFWKFRIHMHPQMQRGWFIEEAAQYLQKFYEDYKAGKRPKLVLQAPPQHGKKHDDRGLHCVVRREEPR